MGDSAAMCGRSVLDLVMSGTMGACGCDVMMFLFRPKCGDGVVLVRISRRPTSGDEVPLPWTGLCRIPGVGYWEEI